MQVRNLFAVLSAATLLHFTHALNACPGTDDVFTGAEGIRYRVCPGTDLTGPSTSIKRVASVTACAKLCDQSMDCFKAVYDTRTKACHFKDLTGLTWVANDRFQVIQAEQVNIARCPHNEWTYHRNRVGLLSLCSEKASYTDTVPLETIQHLPRHRYPWTKRENMARRKDFRQLRLPLCQLGYVHSSRLRLCQDGLPHQS
jgi:hypothetical protein